MLDRVQYLTRKLLKKDFSLIAGITPLSENYELIWDTLLERYEDTRSVATSYVKQIFEFNVIKTESADNLDLILQNFFTHTEA